MVTQRSAKPRCAGSIPARASKRFNNIFYISTVLFNIQNCIFILYPPRQTRLPKSAICFCGKLSLCRGLIGEWACLALTYNSPWVKGREVWQVNGFDIFLGYKQSNAHSALDLIFYHNYELSRFNLCPGRESNPQPLRDNILSVACIPFHHPGIYFISFLIYFFLDVSALSCDN